MQDVLVCAGQRTHNLATDEQWQNKLRLVLTRLDEKQRRWIAGLLSEAVGYGGETFAANVTGLDPKTVRSGRAELASDLTDCPTDRVRREGAGRPPVEKTTPASHAT